MEKIRIDIVSDIVCPWCAIGFGRLRKALAKPGAPIAEIHWQPFELNPNMPEGGQNLREHLAAKYGTTREQSIAAREKLSALAADVGFTFHYQEESRTYNTFKAHQLLHWAGEVGDQTAMKVALFNAYFRDGLALDQNDVLIDAAIAAGFERDDAVDVLTSGCYAQTVREQQQSWLQAGIHAVPAFIFNQKYQVSGAQEPEAFTRVFGMLRDEVEV